MQATNFESLHRPTDVLAPGRMYTVSAHNIPTPATTTRLSTLPCIGVTKVVKLEGDQISPSVFPSVPSPLSSNFYPNHVSHSLGLFSHKNPL